MLGYTYPQLLLLGGIAGLVFSVLLLLQKNNFRANKFLALFIFASGLTFLDQYLIETGGIQNWSGLSGFSLPLEFVLPPALYLYIRIITYSGEYKLSTGWHFIPALIGVGLLIPFYVLDFETRLLIIQSHFDATNLPGLFRDTFSVFFIATSLQLLIYLFLSFKVLFLHSRKITQYFVNRKNVSLAWLRNILGLLLLAWLVLTILNYLNYIMLSDRTVYLLAVAFVIYLGVMGLLQPRIYAK